MKQILRAIKIGIIEPIRAILLISAGFIMLLLTAAETIYLGEMLQVDNLYLWLLVFLIPFSINSIFVFSFFCKEEVRKYILWVFVGFIPIILSIAETAFLHEILGEDFAIITFILFICINILNLNIQHGISHVRSAIKYAEENKTTLEEAWHRTY